MKPSLAILLLTACATDPTLTETDQALTDDVAADEITGTCTDDPSEALDLIEKAFGTGSPEHVGGVNCWRQFDNDMRRADALSNFCVTLPPMQRPACFRQVADMRHGAYIDYFWCLVWRSRWWCWGWGGHTQTWSGGDHTQDW